MYCRSISWFICISVAAVIATDSSVPDSTTGSDPEVTVYALRTDNAESSTMEPLKAVNETAATESLQREQQAAAAENSTPSPAPADSGTAPSSQPRSDLSDSSGWTPTTAPPPTATCTAPTAEGSIVTRMPVAATGDSGTSAATQPRSDRSETATSAATPTPGCPLPPPDDALVSYKRRLSGEKKASGLSYAAKHRMLRPLLALLVAGADVGARDGGRYTALHWAALNGGVVAVRCLIEAGAEVNARSRWQYTPLHMAAARGHKTVVQMLVSSDADPNAKDVDGRTPLHHAAYNGHVEVVTTLLEAGAHRGATNNNGDTPVAVTGRGKCQRLTAMLT